METDITPHEAEQQLAKGATVYAHVWGLGSINTIRIARITETTPEAITVVNAATGQAQRWPLSNIQLIRVEFEGE